MPIHDWTRVDDGIFHHLHLGWMGRLSDALNDGLLPKDYYALAEQFAGPLGPAKQRRLSIRHTSDDCIIAIIEIVSRGNKSSHQRFRAFVDKSMEALYRGINLLVIDLHIPTSRDPNGIHGAIWAEISPDPYLAPPSKPLTLAAYDAADVKTAYVEPVAVGDELADMPLFLAPDTYINVPLGATYEGAFSKVPQRWRAVLEKAE